MTDKQVKQLISIVFSFVLGVTVGLLLEKNTNIERMNILVSNEEEIVLLTDEINDLVDEIDKKDNGGEDHHLKIKEVQKLGNEVKDKIKKLGLLERENNKIKGRLE